MALLVDMSYDVESLISVTKINYDLIGQSFFDGSL